VIFSVDVARRAANDHLSDQRDLVLYGLALHRGMVGGFLAGSKLQGRISPAGAVLDAMAIRDMMTRGCDVASPAQILGFEILGFEGDSFHSWLCNGLERDAADNLGIRPNDAGFISSPADAIRVAEYCNRDDVGSEPVLWLPWLAVEYDLPRVHLS
jgi:hypothetical protein